MKNNNIINEGIDFDYESKTVSYNPTHENNVDTSEENNPVKNDIIKDVNIWSIFKRKKGLRGDGNPLIYALKHEKDWKFKSYKDKKNIQKQIKLILQKFLTIYKTNITIIIPSFSSLNYYIANMLLYLNHDLEIIDDVLIKLTTEEIDEIVLANNSNFRKYYKNKFDTAYRQLSIYLDNMDNERNGYFARHLVLNQEMRNVLDKTLKLSDNNLAENANKINEQNILLIDDTISRGQTIQEAINIIKTAYNPKTITVLTLLSSLNDD